MEITICLDEWSQRVKIFFKQKCNVEEFLKCFEYGIFQLISVRQKILNSIDATFK